MKTLQVHYTCPACENDFMVAMTQPLEARGELPPEATEYNPDCCPACGEAIQEDSIESYEYARQAHDADAAYARWLDRRIHND